MEGMAGRECYHCKLWIEDGDAHDCWTTTEAALTRDLPDDLREAWERLREAAVSFGDQRVYASHRSIMFSRKACYCFVRPHRAFLEVCIFLGRTLKHPRIRRADRASRLRTAHILRIRHRDEVEAPITDWMREAYELQDVSGARPRSESAQAPRRRTIPVRKMGRAAKPAPTRRTTGASPPARARKSE
jgi:hypothetical protein